MFIIDEYVNVQDIFSQYKNNNQRTDRK